MCVCCVKVSVFSRRSRHCNCEIKRLPFGYLALGGLVFGSFEQEVLPRRNILESRPGPWRLRSWKAARDHKMSFQDGSPVSTCESKAQAPQC